MKPKRTADLSLFLTVTSLLLASLTFVYTSSAAQDTVFLRKRPPDGSDAMIFIEPTRRSHYYSWLNPVFLDSETMSIVRRDNKLLSVDEVQHFGTDLHEILGQWVPVYKYKNKFYLYIPSDNWNQYRLIVTDSAIVSVKGICPGDRLMGWRREPFVPPGFVQFCGDGPTFDLIRDVKRSENGSFRIRTVTSYPTQRRDSVVGGFWEGDSLVRNVLYTYRDTSTNSELVWHIHKLSSKTSPEKYIYEFSKGDYYIPVEYIRVFPLVINYSKDAKQLEWGEEEDGPFKAIKVPVAADPTLQYKN